MIEEKTPFGYRTVAILIFKDKARLSNDIVIAKIQFLGIDCASMNRHGGTRCLAR
jgi:hypothetical protein